MPNRLRPRPSINFCRTPEGLAGECSDVRKCMWLMFNVEKLRQSVCLRNLVVPGVCCPSATIPLPNPPPVTSIPASAATHAAPSSSVAQPPSSPPQAQSPLLPHPPASSSLIKKPTSHLVSNPHQLIVSTKPIKATGGTSRPVFHSSSSSPTTSSTTTPPPIVTKKPVHSWIQEVPLTSISGHSLSGQASTDSNSLTRNKTSAEARGGVHVIMCS